MSRPAAPAPTPPPRRIPKAVRDVLRAMACGRVSWLWAISMVAGLIGRRMGRLASRAAFLLLVTPVFFVVQLMVYLAVQWSDRFRRDRPTDQAALPRAGVGNGKVAVIVPNYRGEHYLPGLLESLARQTWANLEVLVVDNDSHDGSEQVVRRFANARWIPMESNRGFAAAVNRGAAEAGDAEFLALLNNDTEVAADWAERQVEALRADSRLGIVGARIYQSGFDRRINVHAHVLGRDLRSYNLGAGEDDRGQFDGDSRVLGVSGCSMMIRAQVFREVGGFDEQFFLCYEDVDFSLRTFWRGWDCRVVPEAVCLHVSNAHMSTGSAVHVGNILQNDLRWVAKNVPATLMTRFGAAFLASVIGADELRLFYRWQGLKIVRWRLRSLAGLPRALRARRTVQETRIRSAGDLLPFIRPLSQIGAGRLYNVDAAERYLVSLPPAATAAPCMELFPGDFLDAAGFENAADAGAGREAVTADSDPQMRFSAARIDRRFRRIELEMTCDRAGWGQFVFGCHRPSVLAYVLASNHFRVLPGRHRYAFAVDKRFFFEHQAIAPDPLGFWRSDLDYLRLDPCETAQTRILIHRLGVR